MKSRVSASYKISMISIFRTIFSNVFPCFPPSTTAGKAGPNTERGTERERNETRTREMPVQHLRDSRLPSAFLAAGKKQMAIHDSYISCIWSFHLHLEPLGNCKWFLLRSVLSDRKTNLLPSVTYLHSATVTKCSWELWIVGHGHLHF